MRNKVLLLAVFLSAAFSSYAQTTACGMDNQGHLICNVPIAYVFTDPAGNCTYNHVTVNRSSGNIMGCKAGTWTSIGSGGSVSNTWTPVDLGNISGTKSISPGDANTLFTGTVVGDTVIDPTGPGGGSFVLQLKQDATGGHAVTGSASITGFGCVDKTSNITSTQSFAWNGTAGMATQLGAMTSDGTGGLVTCSGNYTLPTAPATIPAVGSNNTWTGYNDFSGGSMRYPEKQVSTLPTASTVSGRVYMVTDSSTVGSCSSGGGSYKTACRSNGTSYDCVGNCSSSSSSPATLTVPYLLFGYGASSATAAGLTNTVYTTPYCVLAPLSMGNVVVNITTLFAGGHVAVAFADSSGNKLFESNLISTAAVNPIKVAWSDSLTHTLNPGCYSLWMATDNTTAKIPIHSVGSGGSGIQNVDGNRVGYCANAATFAGGAVFPATCGSITSNTTWAYPDIGVEQ